jgi:hypothetical protein
MLLYKFYINMSIIWYLLLIYLLIKYTMPKVLTVYDKILFSSKSGIETDLIVKVLIDLLI